MGNALNSEQRSGFVQPLA